MSTESKPEHPLQSPSDLLNRIAELAPEAYIVGGAVRDILLGRSFHDLDLVVPEGGCRLARHLADALGGAYYALDPERDVGRTIVGGLVIDVACFRGPGLEADLRARDFTINAMAFPSSDLSHLIDPLGGLADLEKKILRQCAPDSIESDPVRAIRAARQAAQFGLEVEAATAAAAAAAGPLLLAADGSLAQPERVRDELIKLLALPTAAEALGLMADWGLLPIILPQVRAANLPMLGRLARLQSQLGESGDAPTPLPKALDIYRRQLQDHLNRLFANDRPLCALVGLAALCHDEGHLQPIAEKLVLRLRLSNEEWGYMSRVESALRHVHALIPPLMPRAIHRYYREVEEAGIDGVLVAAAAFEEEPPESWGEEIALPLLTAFFRRHQQIVAPPPLVDGRDVMRRLKLPPGPIIGDLLARLLEEQAEGTIRTKDEALRLAEKLFRGMKPNQGK